MSEDTHEEQEPSVLICYWCGEKGNVALFGPAAEEVFGPGEVPKYFVLDLDPCEDCQDRADTEGLVTFRVVGGPENQERSVNEILRDTLPTIARIQKERIPEGILEKLNGKSFSILSVEAATMLGLPCTEEEIEAYEDQEIERQIEAAEDRANEDRYEDQEIERQIEAAEDRANEDRYEDQEIERQIEAAEDRVREYFQEEREIEDRELERLIEAAEEE